MLVDCNGVHIKNILVSFLKFINYVILAWFECACRLHICLQVAGIDVPRLGGST
jgi:hypothetical protein